MTSPDPDLSPSEQLDEDELGVDPLERGIEPAEEWVDAGRSGETLDERLAEEEPDFHDPREAVMSEQLSGRTVAILATHGVEEVELAEPKAAVERAGGTTRVVSLADGEIQAMTADVNMAGTFPVDLTVDRALVGDFDALILPGGTTNPDKLRQNDRAVALVRAFVDEGKPVAAICHGPWLLVEADVVRGKTLTSYPSVRTDIRNAGGNVVDEQVVVDGGLITSRNPDDLPAFCDTLVREFAAV